MKNEQMYTTLHNLLKELRKHNTVKGDFNLTLGEGRTLDGDKVEAFAATSELK